MTRSALPASILAILLLFPAAVVGAGAGGKRLARTEDPALRSRLAMGHLTMGEFLDVLAVIPAEGPVTARDRLLSGLALSGLGQYGFAHDALTDAYENGEPGSAVKRQALDEALHIRNYVPERSFPSIQPGDLGEIGPDLSLSLSGYLAQRGDPAGALALLEAAPFQDPHQAALAGISAAGQAVLMGDSVAPAAGIDDSNMETLSPAADLYYLSKGHRQLQAGEPARARTSFLSVSPSSPYAPEALLGKAWALIRMKDLPGAAIVLEELVASHPHTSAAGEGAGDLAVVYRELGLFDRAVAVLESHMERLAASRSWFSSLGEKDLLTGGDILVLLEKTVEGMSPDRELLNRTPPFLLPWMAQAALDPVVIRSTALLGGTGRFRSGASRLSDRLKADETLIDDQIRWVRFDAETSRSRQAELRGLIDRLSFIGEEMQAAIQSRSLDSFAGTGVRTLLSRTGKLKERLSRVESSVGKARGYASLVENLSGAVSLSREEEQLNRVREHAYEGLQTSRQTLREVRESVEALEGQLWLSAKTGAVHLEKTTNRRVTAGSARVERALAGTVRGLNLLDARLTALEELRTLVRSRREYVATVLFTRIEEVRRNAGAIRTARLLEMAHEKAASLREAEARALYTLADVETARMDSTVRSLQEAVQ